jgi:hypothetical protein
MVMPPDPFKNKKPAFNVIKFDHHLQKMEYWGHRKHGSKRKQLIEGELSKRLRNQSVEKPRVEVQDKISFFNQNKSLKKRRFSQRKLKGKAQQEGQLKGGSTRRFNDLGWELKSKICFDKINSILDVKETENRDSDIKQEIFTKNYMAIDLKKMNGKDSLSGNLTYFM